MDTPGMELGREPISRSYCPQGAFQSLLAEMSSRFISVSDEDFDDAAQYALEQLGMLFGMDRSYIFRFSSNMARMRNTHEWCAPGISPQIEHLQHITAASMPWWTAAMRTLRPISISDLEDLPPEATAERRVFGEQGIQSLVCLPLQNHQAQLIGFMGFDAVAEPYHWNQNEIRMLRVVAQIISSAIARNDAYRALKESESRFDQLARQSGYFIWEVDAQGRYTYVSPVSECVLGYTPEELIGKRNFYDLHPAEGREAFKRAAFGAFARKDRFHEFENRAVTKDGRIVWLSTNGLPLLSEDGALLGYRGSDVDITIHKNAEFALRHAHDNLERRVAERTEALRLSEERYQRIVRATRSFVFTVLMDGGRETHTMHEAGIEDVTGYTLKEYQDQPQLWQRTVYPDDMPSVIQHIEIIRAGAPVSVLEHRILHKEGSVLWVRNTSVTQLNSQGALMGYDGLVTDITALKAAEQERDELLESLRHMALSDALTGLPNRRGFYEELERVWNLSCRHPFPMGLLILDLDHFKSINDTYGHVAGDAVIKEYADLVSGELRDADKVCRYAGDELVVILPWANTEETRQVGKRILKKVEQHIFCRGEYDLNVTVSMGGHSRTPRSGLTIKRLVTVTDRALYQAKQSGRNRLCMVDEPKEQPGEEGPVVPVAPPTVTGKGRVLVVDDDAALRALLQLMLEREQYEVRTASSYEEAVGLADRERGLIDVALVDLYLDGRNGLELIEELIKLDGVLVPLIVSGKATMGGAIDSLRSGAYDFIQKPVTVQQLSALMKRAMGQRRLLLENRQYQQHLEAMVHQRGQSLARALEDQKKSYQHTLESLAAVMHAREQQTGEHCRRVAQMALLLASELGVTADELEQIRSGALLHDIGKIAIPDTILLKPGPLSDEEWVIMKTHPQIGYQILAHSAALKEAAQIVLSHQERFDGTGYPQGLKGEEISLGARIFAVVDAYDAMRSDRHYRKALSPEAALEELLQNSGTQFDPYVVSVVVRCQAKMEAEGRWDASRTEA